MKKIYFISSFVALNLLLAACQQDETQEVSEQEVEAEVVSDAAEETTQEEETETTEETKEDSAEETNSEETVTANTEEEVNTRDVARGDGAVTEMTAEMVNNTSPVIETIPTETTATTQVTGIDAFMQMQNLILNDLHFIVKSEKEIERFWPYHNDYAQSLENRQEVVQIIKDALDQKADGAFYDKEWSYKVLEQGQETYTDEKENIQLDVSVAKVEFASADGTTFQTDIYYYFEEFDGRYYIVAVAYEYN